jgi:sugar lactone lactonase YvrE
VPVLTNLEPFRVVHGGRLWVYGDGFPTPTALADDVTIGGVPARISFAAPDRMAVVVPDGVEGDDTPVKVSWAPGATLYAHVGRVLATGLHQVDNPLVDPSGAVYVTYSGSRGQQAAVSVFRVMPLSGVREPFVHGLVNATSMAFGPDGKLYVSSRFEGRVYRVHDDGQYEVIGSDLGIATGLAFAPDGSLFVGDRSGTIFRIDSKGRTETVTTLPGSMAAFHLAMGPDGWLYVSAPTLSTYDLLRRVDESGRVEVLDWVFGRPQGLAFDANGVLHVVEALAGSSGVYALRPGRPRELVLSAPGLVGLAFSGEGALFVTSNDTLYGFGLR